MLIIVLLVVAAISFGLAAFGAVMSGRVNLIALGLCAWVLTQLIPKLT